MNNIQSMLGQFLGQTQTAQQVPPGSQSATSLSDKIPGGLLGGAAAGGIVALLLGNKKARKFAGKAAGYGGAAVVGGLAYRALQNWQGSSGNGQSQAQAANDVKPVLAASPPAFSNNFEISIITAMIAAAKADGHIDSAEQERIFEAVERMQLSPDLKALVLDLLRQPIAVEDVVRGVYGLEQKAEIYVASCLAIDEDDPRERAYLDQLSRALNLPDGLDGQLRLQAQQGTAQMEGLH